jgi:glycosyltransferase involved in cell wall biosynthesis
MRIGVDATSWVNRRGYGRFARNALTRLVALDGETTYTFVIDEESARSVQLPAEAERLTVALSRPPASAAAADSYRPPADLVRLGAAVTRARFDAMLFPSVYTYFPSVLAPTVVGVHDLIVDAFPELTMPGWRARTFWEVKQRVAIRLARRLFTVSESARRAIVARLGVAPERLAVVPEAPDPAFTPRPAADVERESAAIGIAPGDRYLLYAGGISPHKNVETLVDAYASLLGRGVDRLRLVLVGALDDEAYASAAAQVRKRIGELGLGDEVILPGYVSDEALACLYTGAAAVVSPSLAEGFGLPAVEAAACRAPVVLSDIPAHRETLGDDALFFPAREAGSLVEHLEQLLGSEMLRRSLAERGHRRVARYSWDTSAEALRKLLHEVARG